MIDFGQLITNQVFAGVAGAAVVSAVLYQLRAIPQWLWLMAQDQMTASLAVYSEQEVFRQVDLWLGRHPSAKRSRRLTLTEWWNPVDAKGEFELTPGVGPHLLWEGRAPIFVNRQLEQQPGMGAPIRRQAITLTTIGRSRERLERIVDQARNVQDRDVVAVYAWTGHGYDLIERRPRRALDTVYLAAGLREQIVADAQRFIQRRAWYAERGIPHRRGYLFEGPPGTGKSSMAFALAGELRRPVYVLNPTTVRDDSTLQRALNQAGAGVVLIEDIDALDCGQARAPAPPAPDMAEPNVPTSFAETGVSLSGLLNAIDGVAARDGRILIITSNHPEKLDPALIRPGRVDMRCRFGLAGETEARAMFRRFCPEAPEAVFAREIANSLPLSPAEIQNRLLRLAA